MNIINQRNRNLVKLSCSMLLAILFLFSGSTYGTSYYIDSAQGYDGNSGTSETNAWKSLTKVNETTFSPGDKILFKCNGIWSGQLYPKGSGEDGSPIVIDKYGFGNLPIINGGGIKNAVYLYNQEYWEIRNLEITNYQAGSNSWKRGVLIGAKDFGAVHHIHLINLVIHDVNGTLDTKDNGGIFLNITGSSKETYFDGILIEGCHIYDVDRTGISNKSEWDTRTLTSNTNWVASLNVVIRNNLLERIGQNGLIVRVAKSPLIEYNIFKECSIKGSGNSNFPFNCDDVVIQYNEAYLTKYNNGDNDSGGFDSDYRCKNTIIQYNYSHDNDYGGVLVCNNGNSATAFNDGTIVRYNIFKNNSHHNFRISGKTTNTTIYNNVIYLGEDITSTKIIWHKSWGGYPDNTSYYNNIFYIKSTSSSYDFGNSTNNKFDYNVFYGNHPSGEPYDAHKLTSDPRLLSPSAAGEGIDNVNGMKLHSSSPCINSGMTIPNNGGRDYWGNPVPLDGTTDRGAYEYGDGVGVEDDHESSITPTKFQIFQNYPNPFNPVTSIRFSLSQKNYVQISVFNLRGEQINVLIDREMPAGVHQVYWNSVDKNGLKAPSGIYLCRLQSHDEVKMIKMVLAK